MSRQPLFFAIAAVLMGATWVLLLAPVREVKSVPLARSLEDIPALIDGWSASNHVPTDVLRLDMRVPENLVRTYERGPRRVWISLDYYPAQDEGRRPPARDLVFPGRGWSTLSERKVEIPLGEGRAIPANMVAMRIGERQVGILYWYQLRGRPVASDHWYRALLIYNRLVHGRADGALVRIAFPIPDGTPLDDAVGSQAEFVQAFYPEIVRSLPP
ncbi:MAG: EpsI family protein [Candidatus Rokubacteria bacterium]|nr:EpsI family protein [Candidatus Rokubacteria bacterium]